MYNVIEFPQNGCICRLAIDDIRNFISSTLNNLSEDGVYCKKHEGKLESIKIISNMFLLMCKELLTDNDHPKRRWYENSYCKARGQSPPDCGRPF